MNYNIDKEKHKLEKWMKVKYNVDQLVSESMMKEQE
jgi:anion-transporting  ArsA/GET3 family ATPase